MSFEISRFVCFLSANISEFDSRPNILPFLTFGRLILEFNRLSSVNLHETPFHWTSLFIRILGLSGVGSEIDFQPYCGGAGSKGVPETGQLCGMCSVLHPVVNLPPLVQQLLQVQQPSLVLLRHLSLHLTQHLLDLDPQAAPWVKASNVSDSDMCHQYLLVFPSCVYDVTIYNLKICACPERFCTKMCENNMCKYDP